MGQPKKKTSLEQVLKLVDWLSVDEQEKLRAELNSRSKAERWQALCDKVQRQSEALPPITDAEILADMSEIRAELKAERAQGSR
ncbi:hypothetical protein KA344_15125 [bacterium]|jgi:hypothetical protein|nr:hypothetical protein [bacterium]